MESLKLASVLLAGLASIGTAIYKMNDGHEKWKTSRNRK
jgi:hypothetical protein